MSEAVKQMLTEDIQRKKELESIFRRILLRQTITLMFVSAGFLIIILYAVAYFAEPTHVDNEVVQSLKYETEQLRKERILLGAERDALKSERERFAKIMLDSIKYK